MKIKFGKSGIALLTAVILEACSLISCSVTPLAAINPAPYVLSKNLAYQHLPLQHLQQQTASVINFPANTQKSGNWAGYIATPTSTDNGYTGVSGRWTVPNITASQQNAAAAQWIGLGGVSSNDLLQMGTIEDVENGRPVAYVFWEQLPSTAQYVMSVPIGSTIDASITPSDDSSLTWNLTFTVNGKKQSVGIPSVTLDSSYAQGIGTSAEWISEDPSNGDSRLLPLANMGTVSYTAARVDGNPINSQGNNVIPVAMASNYGNILIAPSQLGDDGESFSTSITNANTNTNPRPAQRYGQTGNHRSHSSWSVVIDDQGYQFDSNGWTWTWTWSW